jgi:predicted AAA+ superfamily ATPase
MFKNYVYLENGYVNYEEKEVISTSRLLQPGLYELKYMYSPHYRVFIEKLEIRNTNQKIKLTNINYIEDIFKNFIDDEKVNKLRSINIENRFGILLYGEAGTGKSSIIYDLISRTDTISFTISNKKEEEIKECWDVICRIRKSQDTKIIVIFDEFDEYMHSEGIIKQIMDGQYSIDNCLFLMSTNYIDNIPATIKDRPSRCKYKIKIEGVYDLDFIKSIIEKLELSDSEIEKYANELKGKTIDEIKEFCIDRILNLKEFKSNSNKIGFQNRKI